MAKVKNTTPNVSDGVEQLGLSNTANWSVKWNDKHTAIL